MSPEHLPAKKIERAASIPVPKLEGAEPSNDEVIDALAEAWLRGESVNRTRVQPDLGPTVFTDQSADNRSALQRLSEIARSRSAQLITAASVLVSACNIEWFKTKFGDAPETDAHIAPLVITMEQGDTVITLDTEHAIRISDLNELGDGVRPDWDKPLVAEAHSAFVELNPTFQMHKQIAFDQYTASLDDSSADIVSTAEGPLGTRNKYLNEPSRMQAGDYPLYRQVYGNMEQGDEKFVREEMKYYWSLAAARLGVEELDDLTAAEWMQVLQEPGTILNYDRALGSMFDEFDPKYTADHNRYDIAQLMQDGKGVCRDIERLNITSYMLADEEFHLSERGLLYIPVVNIADAAHTRGMFWLALSPTETVVVGVDTTNSNRDVTNSFFTASGDVAAWYSQQFGKEFMRNPNDTIAAYTSMLEIMPNMGPTARAMLLREITLAKIAAEDYKGAYDDLSRQLDEERTVSVNSLQLPSRLVPMYDLLVAVGAKYDKVDKTSARPIHKLSAQQKFADYLERFSVDRDEAVAVVQQIDYQSKKERQEYIQTLQLALERLNKL